MGVMGVPHVHFAVTDANLDEVCPARAPRALPPPTGIVVLTLHPYPFVAACRTDAAEQAS